MGALLSNEFVKDIGYRGRRSRRTIHRLGLDQAPLNMAFVLVIIRTFWGPIFRFRGFNLRCLLSLPKRLYAL